MNHIKLLRDNKNSFGKLVENAKKVLPLEKMLTQLDDWELCVAKKLCPFHDDHSPSFSVFTYNEQQFWKCHAGCGSGDQINFLELKFNLTRGEAVRLFLEMSGLRKQEGGSFYE